jgi:hypothetical protein
LKQNLSDSPSHIPLTLEDVIVTKLRLYALLPESSLHNQTTVVPYSLFSIGRVLYDISHKYHSKSPEISGPEFPKEVEPNILNSHPLSRKKHSWELDTRKNGLDFRELFDNRTLQGKEKQLSEESMAERNIPFLQSTFLKTI